jgi:signal transduction histidine kinase
MAWKGARSRVRWKDERTADREPARHRLNGEGSAAQSAPDPQPDVLQPATPSLRIVVGRVAQEWLARDHDSALLADDPLLELDRLARALDDAVQHGAAPVIADDANRIMQRRLLELIQAELVREWSNHPEPPATNEMLRVLQALSQARLSLDPEWGYDPVALLTAPDGLGLVAEVAHDLRSPLTAILFLSDTLRRGHSGKLNSTQRRQVGLVYSATLALINVASDLIELARGGNHLAEGELRPFSIAETLESVHSIILPMAEEKGITVHVSGAEPDQRVGYPIALNRVLLNLATNALKFTDEGVVEITAKPLGRERVRFSVRDTGRGISAEAQKTLFFPFHNREDSGYRFSGSGLGLVIARRLVEAMGSELVLESRSGWGTRFHFDVRVPTAPPV